MALVFHMLKPPRKSTFSAFDMDDTALTNVLLGFSWVTMSRSSHHGQDCPIQRYRLSKAQLRPRAEYRCLCKIGTRTAWPRQAARQGRRQTRERRPPPCSNQASVSAPIGSMKASSAPRAGFWL